MEVFLLEDLGSDNPEGDVAVLREDLVLSVLMRCEEGPALPSWPSGARGSISPLLCTGSGDTAWPRPLAVGSGGMAALRSEGPGRLGGLGFQVLLGWELQPANLREERTFELRDGGVPKGGVLNWVQGTEEASGENAERSRA